LASGKARRLVRLREGGNPVEQHGTDNTIHVEPNSNTNTGAQFIQLQVCMNMQTLRDYVSRLISTKLTWRIQMLAELAVFSLPREREPCEKFFRTPLFPPMWCAALRHPVFAPIV